MPQDVCNSFLDALALLNGGADHGCSYVIERLPDAVSLDASLALYFESMSTSNTPPQQAERWGIRRVTLPADWTELLARAGRRWFFEQDFSPKTDSVVVEEIVRRFLWHLQSVVGDASACSVEVEPPMWYECVWEDFAFESRGGRWLLHFGFSD